jgi:hypothetical protein
MMETETFRNAAVEDVYNLLSIPLERFIKKADGEAAFFLHHRMRAFDWMDEQRERSYAERGLIAIEFEKRKLWQYLDDPATKKPYTSFNAWASSRCNGARSVTFDAKRDLEALQDVPAAELRDIPKGNLKVLKQLSTAVRKEPAVLQAARSMTTPQFLESIEKLFPEQHIESPIVVKVNAAPADASTFEEAIQYAIDHEIAANRSEAMGRMAYTALEQWRLEAEIDDIDVTEMQ